MCDKDKCVRGTEECDADKWEKEREGEAVDGEEKDSRTNSRTN